MELIGPMIIMNRRMNVICHRLGACSGAGSTLSPGTATYRLDHRRYPVGRKTTDAEFARVNLTPVEFHGEWNYTVHPTNNQL